MARAKAIDDPILKAFIADLGRALGDRLASVVLYGSAARGDHHPGTSDYNLIVVLDSLEPAALEAAAAPIQRWVARGQTPPRLFTPDLIATSSDVFPIEYLDIRRSHVVLHGSDPFASIHVPAGALRAQCEREMKEKMMRLREGYVAAHGDDAAVARLLTDSYTSFVALFRACLHLLGDDAPLHNDEVAAAFCRAAGIDSEPFLEVDGLKRGGAAGGDARRIYAEYHAQLARAVARVDRFQPGGGTSR